MKDGEHYKELVLVECVGGVHVSADKDLIQGGGIQGVSQRTAGVPQACLAELALV
jgi:hypothetical protein